MTACTTHRKFIAMKLIKHEEKEDADYYPTVTGEIRLTHEEMSDLYEEIASLIGYVNEYTTEHPMLFNIKKWLQ